MKNNKHPRSVTNGALSTQTLEAAINGVLAKLRASGTHPILMHSYTSSGRSFLRHCSETAKADPAQFDENDCARIREAMLKYSDLNSTWPRQQMALLRYLLARVAGFPLALLNMFRVQREGAQRNHGLSTPFTQAERTLLFARLHDIDWTTRGIVLLAANLDLLAGDLALVTWEDLHQPEVMRVRTNAKFHSYLWESTRAWMVEQPPDANAVYVFPELVFSMRELTVCPQVNQQPITIRQSQIRMVTAARRVLQRFAKYLLECGITRHGASFRSFRAAALEMWKPYPVRKVLYPNAMRLSANQTAQALPEQAIQARQLGWRVDIGLAGHGLLPDKKRKGKITAMLYSGFLRQNGTREIVMRRTGQTDLEMARKMVQDAILPQLFAAWDARALAAGRKPQK